MKSFIRSALFLPLMIAALAVAVFSVYPPTPAQAATAPYDIYSVTYDAASTVDAAGLTAVVKAPSAVLGDACVASLGVDAVDMTLTCYVQAAGLAEVRIQNESTATVDLASTTVRVFILHKGTR